MPGQVRSACRLVDPEVRLLARLDDVRLPMAEVHRRFARRLAARGRPRPSYERTRTLLHELRTLSRIRPPAVRVRFEVAVRTPPMRALAGRLMPAGLSAWFP